jgi:hypothetical protein
MNSIVTRSIFTVATAGVLCGIGAGAANAATTTSHTDDHARTVANFANVPSVGIHLANASGYRFTLTQIDGDKRAGVPVKGAQLLPGRGYQDFEVTFNQKTTTHMLAYFDVYDLNGTKVGTATVDMSSNSVNWPYTSATFKTTNGSAMNLQIANEKSVNPTIQAVEAGDHEFDPNSPDGQKVIDQICGDGTSAQCTFHPTDDGVPAERDVLLADSYNGGGGAEKHTTKLTANLGFNATLTEGWGVSSTVSTNVANAINIGLTLSYNHTTTNEKTFSTTQEMDVDEGFTGFITSKVPVKRYTGTFIITLGNDTWTVPGVHFDDPAKGQSITEYGTHQEKGDQRRPVTPGSLN